VGAERRRRPRPRPGSSTPAPTDARARPRKNTGHTGGHNGGRIPTNLWTVIDHEPVFDEHGTQIGEQPITMIDRACQVMRRGGFAKDAAARLGVRVETFRAWLTLGAQTARALANGQTVEGALTDYELQCMELELRTWQAEYEGRQDKIEALDQIMRGGFERIRVVEKRAVDPTKDGDEGVLLERTEHRELAMPDSATIRWWLQIRYPDEFRQQVAVTGPDGGPVVDLERPVERLREVLARFAESGKRAAELPIPGATNGNTPETTDV
jgi:hypothetical protein